MATTAAHTRRRSPARQIGEQIAHYTSPSGYPREIITIKGRTAAHSWSTGSQARMTMTD